MLNFHKCFHHCAILINVFSCVKFFQNAEMLLKIRGFQLGSLELLALVSYQTIARLQFFYCLTCSIAIQC